ncbi:MAG TPA: 16S rRNA (guanine(966)-N(2))-methyltransferase RsmD [Terriglobales bacterium]|jgi:16S rRNA (guanine966-N2)-methyltransferase|nr:16S rRNA (guanine(966)-N(2))-methyltransferase RsmD [Terriglobales bacterium]
MRVIAGKYRSRPLRSLRGLDIRPTSDRLRETLFNVLVGGDPGRLAETVWLDLYAGTGAVGIEALSRGAHMVYFVEESTRAAELVRQNLRSLSVEGDSFEVVERDVLSGLRRLDAQAVTCDFCFLDPPYRQHASYEQTLGFLAQSHLLQPASVVVAEHDRKFDAPAKIGALQRYRKLEQGDAGLSFYKK